MILGTGRRRRGDTAGGGGGGGYFIVPTILTGMTGDMLMSSEETFAPVAGLYKFDTEDEAVRWANGTSMGLASYAFTKNVDRMWRMLENLEAGMIGMVSVLAFRPSLPPPPFFCSSFISWREANSGVSLFRIPATRPQQRCRLAVSRIPGTARRATWPRPASAGLANTTALRVSGGLPII